MTETAVPEATPCEETKPEIPKSKGRRRPAEIAVTLKPGEPVFPGDVLVVVKGKPLRLSVRPKASRCPCQAHGWVILRVDDGSRFGLHKPVPCGCVLAAVATVAGKDFEIDSWAPMSWDDVAKEYLRSLQARQDEVKTAIVNLTAEREQKVREFEAERDRLLGVADAALEELPEIGPEILAARAEYHEAFDEIVRAEKALADAEQRKRRAEEALGTVEAPLRAAEQKRRMQQAEAESSKINAARMDASAKLLHAPESSYSLTLKRLGAVERRVGLELELAAVLKQPDEAVASAPVVVAD